uniref:BppU family phage baseplate upper protein n=1 Tax=Bacillus cereus group sp. BfR-BA-01423 TaxID=2920340 RepID=UPI001F591387
MKQAFEITVDIQKETNHTDIKFSQNSLNTSELNINIADDGKEFALLDSDKIIVYFKKPDQKVVFQDQQIKILDKAKGKINVLLTTQTLIKAGKVYGDISIEREEGGVKKRVNTYDFSFEVRSSYSAYENIEESANELQILDKVLETGEILKDVNVPALIESEKVATEAKEATVQLSNQIGILSENVNGLQTQLVGKADKSYVDTKVSAVASGSPKGTYATLTDLQTAKPTGDSN